MQRWQLKFKWWQWLLISLVLVVYFWPYARLGLPITHDGENHAARFAQYYLAVKQGQWPPRVAPMLENGFGYPVFNYNYPLANMLSLPLAVMKVDFELAFKIIIMMSVVMGVIACERWWSYLLPENKQLYLPLLAYLLTPYLYHAIWYRGNIGEVMIYGLLPVVVWQIERVRAHRRGAWWWLVVTGSAFLLAHNVMVLLCAPLILAYGWWRIIYQSTSELSTVIKKQRKTPSFYQTLVVKYRIGSEQLKMAVIAATLTLGCVGWFWWPALAEKKLVVMDNASINNENLQHAVRMNQLLKMNYSDGFSYIGDVDGLGFGLGVTAVLVLMVSVSLLLTGRAQQFYRPALVCVLVTMLIVLLLCQLPMSVGVWQQWPGFNFVQFPWRWSLLTALLSVLLLAVLKNNKWQQQLFWLCVCFLQLVLAIHARPTAFLHKNREDYLFYPQSTTTMRENAPKTWMYDVTEKDTDRPEVATGSGTVTAVERLDTSKKKYQVQCKDECLIIEPTANFAGFVTLVDGEQVEYVDDEWIRGRIAYRVPAGDYQVETTFTQNTAPRRWGNGVSVMCVVIVLGWGWWLWYQSWTKRK